MIDSTTSAAFALRGRPGAYALLIGSGISTSAGIPTGWRIVELLIRELAAVDGQDVGYDEPAWYAERYGFAPTYSGLVGALGLTIAERQALIARFLNGEDGQPRPPAPAHRAIARLVAGGWIKVIITTNFDPLLEMALVDAGVNVTVLASPDDVAGAVPLVHAGPVLVKLHGDQNDPRILNTEIELDEYAPEVDALLDRVFNDYGLIVAGWSAASDAALRRAIQRSPNRRFTTFWTTYSELTTDSAALATARDAEVIGPVDGDTFFGRLADACDALSAVNAPDRRSVTTTVAVAKRELSGGLVAIGLHDTIRAEIDRLQALPILNPSEPAHEAEGQGTALDQITSECEMVVSLVATAAYWGRAETDRWWTSDIVRMARAPVMNGSVAVIERPCLPALFMCWAAGIAAVAARRDDLLTALFSLEDVEQLGRSPLPAVFALSPRLLHATDSTGRLYRQYRPVFVDHLGIGRSAYIEAWERWQYLLYLAGQDTKSRLQTSVHIDRAGIRVDGFSPILPVPHTWALGQAEHLGAKHPLLQAGYFDGDAVKLAEAIRDLGPQLGEAAENDDYRILSPGQFGSLPSGRHYPRSFSDDPDVVFGSSPTS